MQDSFVANLGRIYGLYTGSFLGFVVLLGIQIISGLVLGC